MNARVLLLLAVVLIGGCTVSPSRTPPPLPPAPKVQPPPAPVVEASKPVVESQPSLPPVEQPAAPVVMPPETKPAPATPAATLLASVQAAITAGDLNRAAALCERALRISPRDAQLWYQLALIRYQQHRNDDAAGSARRALTMAGKDTALTGQINALLAKIPGR